MKSLVHNILACFTGRAWFVHISAIVITYVSVMSGFDWFYFQATQGTLLQSFLFPAIVIGGLLPLCLPLIVLAVGALWKRLGVIRLGWVLAQAAFIGWFISSLYKAFTGRVQPELFNHAGPDISHNFNFGFFEHGIFWGWPSSHTTVAFAMAAALVTFYPKNRLVWVLALVYAFYVGIGVSVSIHWFSDFIAGALIGSLVGVVVGRSFLDKKDQKLKETRDEYILNQER